MRLGTGGGRANRGWAQEVDGQTEVGHRCDTQRAWEQLEHWFPQERGMACACTSQRTVVGVKVSCSDIAGVGLQADEQDGTLCW